MEEFDNSALDRFVPLVAVLDVAYHQPVVVVNVTLVRFVQPSNTYLAIDITLDGIVIDVIFMQPLNAL